MASAPSTAAPLAVQVAAGFDGLDGLRDEWRALYDATPAEPSLSFEWTRALATTQVRDGDTTALVQIRRDGCLAGVVPLLGRAPRVFGVRHRVLRPLSELKNTHSDLLLAHGDSAIVEAFLGALQRLGLPWDSLRLSKLVQGTPLTAKLEAGAGRLGFLPRRRYRKPFYWLALPSTFDEYWASRSAKFRNHARRAEKKLRAAGKVREVHITTPEEFDAGYDALVQIERASWKDTHGTSMAASDRQAALYRAWGTTAPPGHVSLQLLLLDEEPIAHNLGCVKNGIYYYLKTSYAANRRPLSPATFLRLSLIRQLIERGVREVDFCGPPYEWEQQWTDTYRWHEVLSVYAPTLRGRAFALVDPWTHYSTAEPVFANEDPRRQSTPDA